MAAMHPCAVKSGGYEPEQYARYKDKGELFAAVLQRQIDRWLAMNETGEQAMTGRIEDVLLARARRTVAVALTSEAIAINRIVMAEATRFPNLAKLVHEQGWQRSNAAVAAVLDGFAKNGQIEVEDTNVAADLFLSLVIGHSFERGLIPFKNNLTAACTRWSICAGSVSIPNMERRVW
jgi:TetR/AcrR family transcriptional repressor of mexJK operon